MLQIQAIAPQNPDEFPCVHSYSILPSPFTTSKNYNMIELHLLPCYIPKDLCGSNQSWKDHGIREYCVVKSQIGSGQAMEPSNILVLGLLHGNTVGQQAKKQHFFIPIVRSIVRKAGSLNSGKVTRDHKQRRQTHKDFPGNNQNSDKFTVMLWGCYVQKCLSMLHVCPKSV